MTPLNLDPNVDYLARGNEVDIPEWRKGLGAFGKETKALGAGLVALGTQAAGFEGTRDRALANYQRNMEEAQSGWRTPDVGQVEDIQSAGDFGKWLGYQVPKGLAQLGMIVGTGGVAGGVAKLTAKKAVKDMAKAGVERLAADAARKGMTAEALQAGAQKQLADRALAGMHVGGIGSALGMETGFVYGKLANDEKVGPEAAVGPSLAYGSVAAALEYLPMYAAGKALGLNRMLFRDVIKKDPGLAEAAKELSRKQRALQVAGKVGKGFASGAALEGITEGMQSLAEQAATKYAQHDPEWASVLPTTKEGWSDFWNSVAVGAAVGGAAGGAIGPFTGKPQTQPTPEETTVDGQPTSEPSMAPQPVGEPIVTEASVAEQPAPPVSDVIVEPDSQGTWSVRTPDAVISTEIPTREEAEQIATDERARRAVEAAAIVAPQADTSAEQTAPPTDAAGAVAQTADIAAPTPRQEDLDRWAAQGDQAARGDVVDTTIPPQEAPTIPEAINAQQDTQASPVYGDVQGAEQTPGQEVQLPAEDRGDGVLQGRQEEVVATISKADGKPFASHAAATRRMNQMWDAGELTIEGGKEAGRQARARVRKEGDGYVIDKLESREVKPLSEAQANFKQWSNDLPVIAGASEYSGGPAVFQVAHGTTHGNIIIFDRRGNTEGYLGAGPYFSTSTEDVSANYAGEGPDLTIRINREAEQISETAYGDSSVQEELLQDYFDEVLELKEITDAGFVADIADAEDSIKENAWDQYGEQAVRYAARKAIKGDNEGLIMPTYVRLDNPANIANDNQVLELQEEFDDSGDPVGEPTGSLIDWINAARSVEWAGVDVDGYISALMDAGPEVTMKEAFELLQGYSDNAYDDTGEMLSPGAIFSMIAEEAGYDGAVMNAWEAFNNRRGFGGVRLPGMQGVTKDTLHVVPFKPQAGQVKSSIGNRGTYEQGNPNILESRASTPTHTTIDFVAATDTVLGQGWTQRAIDAGILQINETSKPGSASGTFRQSTGQLTINLDRTPRGQSAVSVLLHEASHAGMEKMLGAQFATFHADLQRLAEQGSYTAKMAMTQATDALIRSINASRVAAGLEAFPHQLDGSLKGAELAAEIKRVRELIESKHPGLLREEDMAYYVQLASSAKPKETGYWNRLKLAIQAWFAGTSFGQALASIGWRPEMSPQLAVALAKQSAKQTLARAEAVNEVAARQEVNLEKVPAEVRLVIAGDPELQANLPPTEARIADTLNSLPINFQLPTSWFTDPTSPAIEDVREPGKGNKIFHALVDRFQYVKGKSSDLYRAFDEWKNRQGAMMAEVERQFVDPMRHMVSRYKPGADDARPIQLMRNEYEGEPLDKPVPVVELVGHQLAARHVIEDNVNDKLATRAAPTFLKELKKQLTAHQVGLLNADILLETGGSTAIDKLSEQQARTIFEKHLPSANPASDIGQRWELFKRRSSGYSTATPGSAAAMEDLLAGFANAYEIYTPQVAGRQSFQEIAELSDKLAAHQRALRVEGGLIDQAQADRLATAYAHYVPMRREAFDYDKELADIFERPASHTGKLMTRTGSEVSGYGTAVHVLQNHLAQGFTAAAAATRNQMMNKFADELYADKDAWKDWFRFSDKHENNGAMGLVRGGKELFIIPAAKNMRAAAIARVITGMDAQQLAGPLKIMQGINGWIRWTNVSASPAFMLTNVPRDYLTARYNLLASDAAEYAKEIGSWKSYKESFKALHKVIVQGVRETTDPKVQEWIDLVEDFEKAGGKTSFVEALKAMDGDSWKSFEAQVGRRQGKAGAVLEFGRRQLETLENLNIVLENTMRLSAFKVMRDKVGTERAAEIARNLTTNFTRRGAHVDAINTWWLFYNATVQGNWQVVQNLLLNPNKAGARRLQKAVAGTVLFAFILDQLGRALSDDEDKDGMSDWDSRAEYEKERKISLPIKVGGAYPSIPAPWVFNVFWRMGGMLGEVKDGVLKPQDAVLDSVGLVASAMDPVGATKGSLAQAVSPSAFDPFMQIIENRDFVGNPLGPDGYPGASKRPDAYLTWDSTPGKYKHAAEFVNRLTGGNEVESGSMDFRPSTYETLANFLMGSLGRLVLEDLPELGMSPFTDKKEFETWSDAPIVKVFGAAPSDGTAVSLYHDRVAQVLGAKRLVKEYSEGPNRDPKKLAEVRRDRAALLRMVPQVEDVERQIKNLRKAKRSAQARGDSRMEEVLRDRIVQIQKRLNSSFARRVGN